MAYVRKEYNPAEAVTQAQQALQNQQSKKPGQYQSQWQGKLDASMDKLLNRDAFHYDLSEDALYRQYRDQYVSQGKLAMQDAVGMAQAMTGGYGNTYAQTAGQQTYQNYLQKLHEMTPQFYQLALDRYKLEGDTLLGQYQLLSEREQADYGKYQDALSQYYSELDRLRSVYDQERSFDYAAWSDEQDFAYGQHRDQVADQQWQTSFDYQQQQNRQAYEQWLQEFEYQKAQDKLAYEQWMREFEEDQRRYNQEWAAAQAKASSSSSRSSGSKKKVSESDQAAYDYVDRMLANISSSRADPERIIANAPSSVLSSDQKSAAQKYLSQLLKDGALK